MASLGENLRRRLSHLLAEAWSLVQAGLPRQEVGWLLSSRRHLSLLSLRRASMLLSRVRLVAGLFAILTPLWIILDVAAFPRPIWLGLGAARILATIAFAAILGAFRGATRIRDAYLAMGLTFAVPSAFFLFCHQFLAQYQFHGFEAALSTGYFYLPFVMMAGIAIFPLTLQETITFIAPLLIVQIAAAVLQWPVLDWPTFAASFWLLMLISTVAGLAALSQLAFIIVLIHEAVRDPLTGCYSRRSGEELLSLEFAIAQRRNSPLSVAFIDLDHFKAVNDGYGHDAGDRVLAGAAQGIQRQIRASDLLIRWGGEEFIVVLPATSAKAAETALTRTTAAKGLGERPDGSRVTASIGIAERGQEEAADWRALVERADQRMYGAKQGGRDRIVSASA